MSFTYPLELPNGFYPKGYSLRIVRKQSKTTSDFTGTDQIFIWPGEYWELIVRYPPLTHEQERILSAKLLELNGSEGTFYWYPPDIAVKGNASGNTTVLKSVTNSRKVVVTCSADLNIQNWLLPGDYFSFANGELKRVVAVASTDGSGDATLEFVPKIRVPQDSNSQIRTVTARGIFRLVSPDFEVNFYNNLIADVSFMAKEAL